MLDHRGYGKSGGSPIERGLYADADAAYLYLLNHGYSARHILPQGESLGTAVAVDLASRLECAGVVLEGRFHLRTLRCQHGSARHFPPSVPGLRLEK